MVTRSQSSRRPSQAIDWSNEFGDWEMSYYLGDANSRLSPYLQWGMQKNQLSLGFSAESKFAGVWDTVGPQAQQTIADGYAGGMMFDYENQPASITLMQALVNGMDGPGSWNTDPSCG